VVLTAGQEVSDDLLSYRMAKDKLISRESELNNLEKAVNYTLQLVRYGSATYTEVLTAQQTLLSAQLDRIRDYLQQRQAAIALYRSLGGGWK
jgi:outer membrane protein, multidrug efflux system